MATVRKWANVAVAMQSSLATALTVSAISKASTGVVSYSGTDPTNGDFVIMSAQGMHQVDGRVFRVANVDGTGNTFELEGEDTSGYETFASGSAQVITFGTTITSMTTVNASGGDFDFIDTTTIHVNVKTQIPGLANPLSYSFENLWDMADAAQAAMKVASDAQSQRAFKFTFGTGGPIMVFSGYVGSTGAPTGNAQDKITSPAVITAFGRPTYYAS